MNSKSWMTGIVAVSGAVLLMGAPAFAAGNGYAPVGSPSVVSASGFSQVIEAKTLSTSGGMMMAHAGTSALNIVVPQGAFSSPVQITLTDGNASQVQTILPSSEQLISSFGVHFSQHATLHHPISITVNNPAIQMGTEIFQLNANGLVKVPSVIRAGQATMTLTSDPDFVIVKPSATVVGATKPVTGMPFETDVLLGAGVAAVGAFVLMGKKKKGA